MKTIYYECEDCRGTGLYSGLCEPPKHAVVCLGCDGTGRAWFKYKPFTGRKTRKDIKTVSIAKGRFILTGIGSGSEKVSYQDFMKGRLRQEKV